MMDLTAAMIGLVGFCGLLLYIMFQLDGEHFLLKLLIMFVFLAAVPLIPKALLEAQDHCDIVLNRTNETYRYGANYTGYHYDDYGGPASPSLNDLHLFHKETTYHYSRACTTNNTETYMIMYRITMPWLWRLFVLYMVLFLTWYYLRKTGVIIKAKDPKGHKLVPYKFKK